MTNETLDLILRNLNNDFYKKKDIIFRQINEDVDLININDRNCFNKKNREYYDFFLIKGKNTSEKYVGIIYDMISDLHIYINETYRGKGYLKNTLVQTILSYLSFYEKRKVQELTFQNDSLKEYFIKEFNFIEIGKLSASLNIENFAKNYTTANQKSVPFEDEEVDDLFDDLNHALLILKRINSKITIQNDKSFIIDKSYLEDYCDEIKDDILNRS